MLKNICVYYLVYYLYNTQQNRSNFLSKAAA
ncbi:hypothetical protein SGRA_2089 [Saprospira grandis str. Lewin]|uniref:Uncharacterized protein n=1 Tax=Saprospira grandis (strain Lewin) TaxID=984262 RepID=H6L2R3_SAPGL|nr:hypothetical protein SGRA_2089 [Saprospira grandis str. Lewin]